MLMVFLLPLKAYTNEAYVVFNNSSLMFYYDNDKANRTGDPPQRPPYHWWQKSAEIKLIRAWRIVSSGPNFLNFVQSVLYISTSMTFSFFVYNSACKDTNKRVKMQIYLQFPERKYGYLLLIATLRPSLTYIPGALGFPASFRPSSVYQTPSKPSRGKASVLSPTGEMERGFSDTLIPYF